jgi:predicted RNase H-like nuclease (RuvC/YqgF family)
MTPEGIVAVLGGVGSLMGVVFGFWQWSKKHDADRDAQHKVAEAVRERDTVDLERQQTEFAFKQLQAIIARLEKTNEKMTARLDAAEARHQEDRQEHSKCREQLASLEQKTSWQETKIAEQSREIAELHERISRLEGSA